MPEAENDVILINGVNTEIGYGIGSYFAKSCAKVAIVGSDKNKSDIFLSHINELGGEAISIVADMRNPGHVKDAARQVLDKFGRIDVLVNNVNAASPKKTPDLSDTDWNDAIASNLNPMFYFCREIIPAMREKKYGRIINIGSLYYLGWPAMASHSTANSAIFGFTRSLALEVAHDNITANCIAVGDLPNPERSESEVAKLVESIPVQRLGSLDDVGNAVAFLASKASKYVTGQTLFVCGGKSIHFSMSI